MQYNSTAPQIIFINITTFMKAGFIAGLLY